MRTRLFAALLTIPALHAQPASDSPRFEVASIKLCRDAAAPSGGGRKGGASPPPPSSPVSFNLPCSTPRFLIRLAYLISQAQPGTYGPVLEGGPDWLDSDRYLISAKSAEPVSKAVMNGAMLRELLEERFALKMHSEPRDYPTYALTVARGGLKLKPFDGTSCLPRDPDPSRPPGAKPWCGQASARVSKTVITTDLPGASMTQIAHALASEHMIVDHTGVPETDKFDLHIEYAPDNAVLSGDSSAPTLESALGQLGLRLERIPGKRDYLIIDHIERPAEN